MADNTDKETSRKPDAEAQAPEQPEQSTAATVGPQDAAGEEHGPGDAATGSEPSAAAADEPPQGPPAGREAAAPKGDSGGGGGSGTGLVALLLVLLVAIGAGAGGYYLWQELEQLRAGQQRMVGSEDIERLEAQVERRLETSGREAAELRARMSALGEDRAAADRAVVRLEETVAELRRNQQTLVQRMGRIDAMAEAQRADWIRGEAAYLARVAQHRLRFHADVEAALDALRMADRLLAELGTDAIPSRQAINRAVDRLLEVSVPDAGELAVRIQELAARLGDLPLAREVERTEAAPVTPDPRDADDWRQAAERAWGRFTETLGQLVIVQREREVVPLLAPPERYFLYQNLRLRLEAARLALLQREQPVYEHSLEEAGYWLRQYYDADDARVQDFIAELERLAGRNVAPALPDLGEVLAPVTEQD